MKNETTNTNNKFVIDFFELAFLTETCLPPTTIARHCFFMNIIDIYYHQMSWEQRNHFYQWIGKKLNVEEEESQIFLARFNPENQYIIKTKYEKKEEEVYDIFKKKAPFTWCFSKGMNFYLFFCSIMYFLIVDCEI